MRVIGLDVHRSMAVVAVLEKERLTSGGRIDLTRDAVIAFGRKLRSDDEVVIEATVNTAAIVHLLRPFVRRVVIANPLQVRAIAHAKIKTDKIDAAVLAKLHASGFLPEVWMPDETTETLRRLVAQRAQVIQQNDASEEPDPQYPSCQPDPALPGRAVQRGRQVLAEDATLGIG
jgi:transposase